MNVLNFIKIEVKLFLKKKTYFYPFFFFFLVAVISFLQSNAEEISKSLIYMHVIILLHSILGSEGQSALMQAGAY